MGIRFRCHHCDHELHVKDFQAGKRGKCPECKGRFRVPPASAPHSLSVEQRHEKASQLAGSSATSEAVQKTETANSGFGESTNVSLKSKSNEGKSSLATSSSSSHTEEAFAANAQWYVRPPSGGQYGPASGTIFKQWLGENRVTGDSLVWRDGWTDWQVASAALPSSFPESASIGLQAPTPPAVPSNQSAETSFGKGSITNPENTGAGDNAAQDGQGITPTSTQIPNEPASRSPVEEQGNIGILGSVPLQPSFSERNRLLRQQRRKRNYVITLVILTLLAILLVVALVVALQMQQ